jgi:hypothetical protein
MTELKKLRFRNFGNPDGKNVSGKLENTASAVHFQAARVS